MDGSERARRDVGWTVTRERLGMSWLGMSYGPGVVRAGLS